MDKTTLKAQISIQIINLLTAIEEYDISATKSIVLNLNNLISEMEVIDFEEYYKITLDNYILFENLLKKYNYMSFNTVNESLQYTLFNFQHIHNKKILEWKMLVQPLFMSKDYGDIDKFIDEQLAEPKGKLYSHEFDDMIKLASLTNNFNKLKLLQKEISQGRMK